VTTGEYNLCAGQGAGVGALAVERLVEGVRRGGRWRGGRGERLCVVRNAGEGVGRLGWWDLV
jgi:ribonuclease P/MRP protein subunit POP1